MQKEVIFYKPLDNYKTLKNAIEKVFVILVIRNSVQGLYENFSSLILNIVVYLVNKLMLFSVSSETRVIEHCIKLSNVRKMLLMYLWHTYGF